MTTTLGILTRAPDFYKDDAPVQPMLMQPEPQSMQFSLSGTYGGGSIHPSRQSNGHRHIAYSLRARHPRSASTRTTCQQPHRANGSRSAMGYA